MNAVSSRLVTSNTAEVIIQLGNSQKGWQFLNTGPAVIILEYGAPGGSYSVNILPGYYFDAMVHWATVKQKNSNDLDTMFEWRPWPV